MGSGRCLAFGPFKHMSFMVVAPNPTVRAELGVHAYSTGSRMEIGLLDHK